MTQYSPAERKENLQQSPMERELFHSRRLLDTELARQRHIHDFGELARKAKDAKAFCQLAAEHVISTFQLEVSAAYVFAKVSGELDESHAIGITDEVAEDLALTWISTRSKEEPSQSTALIYDGTPQGAVHRNQLVQAIACPCYDSEGDLVALFFGARTKRNAEHTQEIESSLLPSFTMFTEHAGGVVSQLRNLATIAKQIAELRHSKDLLGLAIEGAQIGTWDHNELDGTLRFNEYWARIMGYSYEELVTAYPKWSDVTHPDDFEEAQKAYFAHLRGETELYEAVYRMRHKAGHWVWILDRGQVMKRDADGKALRVCGTHMDISDRKNAEADKLSLQKQVEQSQRLESLGVLAGGVAHDFNNILTVIQANTDLALLVLPQESEALLHLVEIERGARRAAGLAAQMLAFAGRGKFVIETIDLTVLVTEMIQLLRVSISKDIHLEHTSLMGSPSFEGDSSQIRQVVMNLIINASEAIGDRAGDIGITTGVVQCDASYLATFPASLRSATPSAMAPGTYVLLEVNDSGCGMDEEVVQKIFEPFFTTKFTGRGLGMAAVLGILRGHGGALRIITRPEEGAQFTILLPSSAQAETTRFRPLVEAPQPKSATQVTILLVDDEESIRRVGIALLEGIGHKVLTAGDGIEALEIMREHGHEIGCVILDLTMPRLDGEATFRKLKALHPNSRVILSSGYMEREATERFSTLGLAGFLQKPYSLAELRLKLSEALGG